MVAQGVVLGRVRSIRYQASTAKSTSLAVVRFVRGFRGASEELNVLRGESALMVGARGWEWRLGFKFLVRTVVGA